MDKVKIKIWGARGSLPAPVYPDVVEAGARSLFDEFFARGYSRSEDVARFFSEMPRHRLGGYGGNTPCAEVRYQDTRLMVDAGSGLRALSDEYMAGPCGQGQGEAHLLFTHFHWDHLIGLPFFTPLFIPGNQIHFYAVQPELPEVIEAVFKKPFFPVPLKQVGATLHCHRLEPRKAARFGGIQVTPYQLDHPDPCWGYKFEAGGKVYSHCVDTECTRLTRQALGPDLPLYQGVDLMAFDAQYTLIETIAKMNWGHAAASIGLDLAMREGIKRVLFMHHDPASSAEKIAAAEAQARRYYESQIRASTGQLHKVEWSFAYDGQEIEL
ncbi:MAG: MBL fold metallo-hydrolase [Oligoflexia bacterium]|nr:MBL fold metallo-hydrolase [Oligoflexia bacterium]